MAYVTPNSDVYLCKGVPIDRDYDHTVYWDTAYNQYLGINAYYKYRLTGYTYQRSGKNKIRVAKLCDDLYDCNYMMFRNTAYGEKWFYAFIDTREYINDSTTEITYTIDVIQTYYFDFDIETCFVEREHSETDGLGENLVPENIDCGDMIVENRSEFLYEADESATPPSIPHPKYTLVIYYVPNSSKDYLVSVDMQDVTYMGQTERAARATTAPVTQGGWYRYNLVHFEGNIVTGCLMFDIPLWVDSNSRRYDTFQIVNCAIATILSDTIGGTIVHMAEYPSMLYYRNAEPDAYDNDTIRREEKRIVEGRRFWNAEQTEFYYPKNNKLLTYPYRSLILSNNDGKTVTYKWEWFKEENNTNTEKVATFNIDGCINITPEVLCYPTDYRGVEKDYENGVALVNFPVPSWSEDSFSKWWAQNREAFIMSVLSSAITTTSSIAMPLLSGGENAAAGAINGAIGGVNSVLNSISTIATARNAPDQMGGSLESNNLKNLQNRIGYYFYTMGITKDMAEVVDGFFSRYGYAVKKLKVPNLYKPNAKLRPHWNYIKTRDCDVNFKSGKGFSCEVEEEIENIFDKGITFWMNISECGNYGLDNRPVS